MDRYSAELIGASCELITPCRGCSHGIIVAVYNEQLLVRLISGAQRLVSKDEVILLWP